MKKLTTTKNEFNPEMLVIARESRGITQKELSDKLKVNQGWLSRVESGAREISDDLLPDLSEVLKYPQSFFFQQDKVFGFGATELFNRKRQSVSGKKLQKIHARINLIRMQISKLLNGIDLVENNIPLLNLSEFRGSVDDIAKSTRAYWKLPPGPINNVMQVIEDNGGIIIPFDFETPKIDAMSIAVSNLPPLFFVNMDTPTSRLRFTLCHELAHVIMHQRDIDPDMEVQADRFASEFLLPSREAKPFLRNLTLPKLGELKIYWKTSMQAILMKATTSNIITDTQARSLWIKLSANGFKTHEPFENEIPKETPTLYNEIIDVYRQDYGYTLDEFSTFINLNEDETKALFFADNKPRLSLIK